MSLLESETMISEYVPIEGDSIHVNVKSIYDLIVADNAFRNPAAAHVAAFDAKVVQELANLQSLTLPIEGLFGDTPITTVQPLISELTQLRSSLSDVQTHTNRLSGVDLNSNRQLPTLPTLMSVAFSYTRIQHLLGNETIDVQSVLFKSLFVTQTTLESSVAVSLTKCSKALEARRGKSDPMATLNSLVQKATELTNTLDAQIELDNLAFDNYLSAISKFSLAQAIYGLPTGVDTWSLKLVNTYIGLPNLVQLLPVD